MLTKSDRRQSSGAIPKQQSSPPPLEQETSMVNAQQAAEPAAMEVPWDENDYAISAPSQQEEEEEPFFFGPEWLKSLGATALDSALPSDPKVRPVEPAHSVVSKHPAGETLQTAPDPAPLSAAPEIREVPQPEELTAVAEANMAEAKPKITIENWLEQAAQRLTQPEQNLLTTLEELEKDLRTQGFRPMEPGTLSAIASETSLSSALAQLSNFVPGNEAQAKTASVPPAEPLWPAAPVPVSQPGPQPVVNKSPEQGRASSSHLDALSSLISSSNASPSSSFNVQQIPAQTPNVPNMPNVRPDTSLEFELETTMKRPAMRLQPIQQRPSPPTQQNQPLTRGRAGERPTTGKTADSSMSYKERLLKGYQKQLAGAYDDAMQEYRIIIRNAPDLLGEVVSNMRALLKITPRYSTGYRVLGDAYMRQGEYLQAMEAYNKALTMAKKAKG
jgi:hypothetical protein